MDKKQLLQHQERLDRAKEQKSKLQGAKEQILRRIQEKYNVETVEEARDLFEQEEKKLEKLRTKLEKVEDEFEQKHGETLDKLEE